MWRNFFARRDLLRVGSLSAAAAALPTFSSAALGGETSGGSGPKPTADSVLVLNMMGGVSQFESFDPKPDAPESIRGTLKPIATSLPGIRFAEAVPKLAAMAHKFSLVRSFSHRNNDHFMSQAYVLSGRPVSLAAIQTEPNVGSIVSYLDGPRNGFPGYIAVPGFTRPGPPPTNLFVGGWLGREYAPFCAAPEPDEPDFTKGPLYDQPNSEADERLAPPTLNLPKELDADRLAARGALRSLLDARLRDADRAEPYAVVDAHYRTALDMLSSAKVREAFDTASESPALHEAYGRTKIGGRCLAARRLIEAGARFVMVDYGYDPEYGNVWDNHNAPSQNHPPIGEMSLRPYHLVGMDRAFAALLSDMEARGLLERTLVVFVTEFGRTPVINKGGGRDHWGPSGSIFFAGGGTRPGIVVGGSDRQGAYPASEPHSPADVAATIYRALGIATDRRLVDRENRPHFVLPEGRPIPGLFA